MRACLLVLAVEGFQNFCSSMQITLDSGLVGSVQSLASRDEPVLLEVGAGAEAREVAQHSFYLYFAHGRIKTNVNN